MAVYSFLSQIIQISPSDLSTSEIKSKKFNSTIYQKRKFSLNCSIFSLIFFLTKKGPVPPNATVVFEVEVFSVSRGPRSMEAFNHIDLDKDKSLTKEEVTILYIREVKRTYKLKQCELE